MQDQTQRQETRLETGLAESAPERKTASVHTVQLRYLQVGMQIQSCMFFA